ncbi:MAG: glycosyltransferase [Chthoniobacterales bacterium]
MWHIYRQILALKNFTPVVLTQKRKNAETFPFEPLHLIPRDKWRFLGRFFEKHITGLPWQLSESETSAMLQILRGEDAKILHVFFGNVAVHLLPLLRNSPVPIVVSFHGADVAGGRISPQIQKTLEEIFARAALIGCRSRALGDDLVKLGCPAEKLRVFRTLIPQKTVYEPRTPPENGAWRILQACRLIEKKGLDLSLRAFAEFSKTHPEAEFFIAGEGPEKEKLQKLAEELKITEKVHLVGFLSQPRLQELFRKTHLFLHPSRVTEEGDREGIPNAMLEAMAEGLPIIATEHGGIPEAATNEVEGFIVPENDVPALVNALGILAKDDNRYQEMSKAAFARIHREFSSAAQAANLEKIYGELLP